MSSSLSAEAEFFLHMGRGERLLCCLRCGGRTRIADQAWAMAKAKAAHVCSMACGCWSPDEHTDTRCGDDG